MEIREELQALRDRIDELEKQVETEEEGKRWKPEEGDYYYCLNSTGEVRGEPDYLEQYEEDTKKIEIGNYFKTEEEAEFMVEKLKVIEELKEFAEPFDKTKVQTCLWYDHEDDELLCGLAAGNQPINLFFSFSEDTKVNEAIQSVGEDRIKKYLFGGGR